MLQRRNRHRRAGGTVSDPTVQSLLDDLVSEVKQENVGAAKQVLGSLIDRFDELRENEQLEIRRSSSARRNPANTNETVQKLTDHILTASETQVSRSAFLLEAVTILNELEDERSQDQNASQMTAADGATELNTLGERLQSQQSDYDDAEAKVAGVKDGQDLPAQVSVQKVEAPNSVRAGRTVPVSTTITNVGDEEAESVVVTATFYQNGTTQQEQAVEIGPLEGGESHEESWPGVADIDRALVAVNSANGSSDTSETTVLVTKTGSDPSVIDYAAPNGTIQLQGLRRAVADWRTDVISQGLLEEIVDAWRTRREVT